MLHEPKEKRQVSFVDPLFIEREDEIAGVGVQEIIGILNPFGDPLQGKNVAEIIVGKKAGEVRLIDFGINSHGASARSYSARGKSAARISDSHRNPGGQTLAGDRFRFGRSSALSVCKPRTASYGSTLALPAGFGNDRVGVGLDDAARHDKLDRIVRADWEFNYIARRQEKVKSCCRVGGAGQKNRNM